MKNKMTKNYFILKTSKKRFFLKVQMFIISSEKCFSVHNYFEVDDQSLSIFLVFIKCYKAMLYM